MFSDKPKALLRFGALAAAGVIALTGCAETGGGNSGSGEGLPYGATKEEFQAAFADIDRITLHTQSPGAAGSTAGAFLENYLKSVEEWSGGKIEFDIAYSDAIAKAAQIDDAVRDGRLDIGQVVAIYEPKEYPATAALLDTSVLSDQSVVTGALQSNAWAPELAFATPEIVAEFEDKDMKLMFPAYNAGVNALFCTDKRTTSAEIKGANISVGNTAGTQQVKSIGGNATSVAYTELYEALQRGVVDCSMSSPAVGILGGFIEAAHEVVIDPDAGLAVPTGNMVVNQEVWNKLPLVARQLLWDRMKIFISGSIEDKIWPITVEAVEEIRAAGGSVQAFDPELRTKLQETNKSILDALAKNSTFEDGAQFAANAEELADKWSTIVAELGYTNESDYNGFADWYSPGKIDIGPFVDKLFEEVFLPNRPS